MCDLYDAGTPPDLVTVCDELARRGKLDEIGGISYVSSLANHVPTCLHGEYYGGIVATKQTLCGLIEVAGQIAAVAYNEPDEEMALAQAERLVSAARERVAQRRQGGQVASGIGRITAQELLEKTLPQPQWAVPGILPAGLTLLAGKPKMGKSWLAPGLALAIATGGIALGSAQVEAGEVLYLALEDTERRLQQRLRQLLPQDHSRLGLERLTFCRQWPRLDQGGVQWLDRWLQGHLGTRLVIVDTLAKVRPEGKPNGSVYAEDYAALDGLKATADKHHVAILVIHHLRKMGGEDPLDEISGTTGFTGVVDNAFVMRRERGRDDAILHMTGRDMDERQLALAFDTTAETWTIVGDAHEFQMSEQRREIIELLVNEGPKRPGEIARDLAKDPSTTRVLLRKMLANGEVISDPNHRYAAPAAAQALGGSNSVNGINGERSDPGRHGERDQHQPVDRAYGVYGNRS